MECMFCHNHKAKKDCNKCGKRGCKKCLKKHTGIEGLPCSHVALTEDYEYSSMPSSVGRIPFDHSVRSYGDYTNPFATAQLRLIEEIGIDNACCTICGDRNDQCPLRVVNSNRGIMVACTDCIRIQTNMRG